MPGAGSGFMNYRRGQPGYKRFRPKRKLIRARVPIERTHPYIPPRQAKAVRAIAKQVVRANEELKFAGNTIANGVAHNASITTADIYQVLPAIAQGQGYNQRVGDKIRPTSLVIDGCVTFNDYGQGMIDTPVSVLVLCLRARKINDPTQILSAPVSALLDNGQTPTSWDGSTLNSMFPINKDEFEVLGAVRVKLSDTTAENTKVMSHRYQMRVKTPAVFHYSSGNYPTNFAPFFVLGWSRDDAVTPTIGQVYVKNTATSRLYYTDA